MCSDLDMQFFRRRFRSSESDLYFYIFKYGTSKRARDPSCGFQISSHTLLHTKLWFRETNPGVSRTPCYDALHTTLRMCERTICFNRFGQMLCCDAYGAQKHHRGGGMRVASIARYLVQGQGGRGAKRGWPGKKNRRPDGSTDAQGQRHTRGGSKQSNAQDKGKSERGDAQETATSRKKTTHANRAGTRKQRGHRRGADVIGGDEAVAAEENLAQEKRHISSGSTSRVCRRNQCWRG